MTTRRTSDETPASRREVARIAKQQAELRKDFQSLGGDFNSAMDRLMTLVNGVQEDVRRGNLARLHDAGGTATRFQEIEHQIGETRDRLNAVLDQVASREIDHAAAAVEGAARGAAQGAAAAAPKRFMATWKGWIVAGGAAIAGTAGAVQGLPPIVRFLAGLIHYVGTIK